MALAVIRLEQRRQLPRHKALVCKGRALSLTAVAVAVELVGHHQPAEAVAVAVERHTPIPQGLLE